MAISGIIRLRSFIIAQLTEGFDQCFQKYAELNQTIFTIDIAPEAILDIVILQHTTNKKDYL
jgi:phosphoribosylformylglycinamidine synthase